MRSYYKRAPTIEERIKILAQDKEETTVALRAVSDSYKKFYNKKYSEIRFRIGDKVLVSSKNIRQLRLSKKLSNKFLGPFEIIAIRGEHG